MENITVEKTNPVIDTARLTLSQLAGAGVKEAADLANKLGLSKAMENYYVAEDKMLLTNVVIQESRYRFMNRWFFANGNQNVIDMACGFSPRGMMAARNGVNYLGLDLESSVQALSGVTASMKDEQLPGTLRYEVVDITNPAALCAAADTMDGSVVMGCEGLIVYLSANEFECMLQGISAVLHKHGGCFVTPDFSSKQFLLNTYIAILGKENAMKALMALRDSIEAKSDTNFSANVTHGGVEACNPLFEKYGLDYELIPYLPMDEELGIFAQLNPQQVTALRHLMAPVMGLRLMPKAGYRAKTFEAGQFKAKSERKGDVVTFFLSGRLDSMTAPKLLEFFETSQQEGAITAITVDMSELEYISSAGLRTLLMMQKTLDGTKLAVCKANETVTEILEQTGFVDLFDVQ